MSYVKKGFMLIELIIVAIIVTILASIAAPLTQGPIIRAKLTQVHADISAMRNGFINMYMNGHEPTAGYEMYVEDIVKYDIPLGSPDGYFTYSYGYSGSWKFGCLVWINSPPASRGGFLCRIFIYANQNARVEVQQASGVGNHPWREYLLLPYPEVLP